VAPHRTTEPNIKWISIRPRSSNISNSSSSSMVEHIRECMAVDTVLAKDGAVSNRRSTLLNPVSVGYHVCIMMYDEMLCHAV
jgi:hypothetical protein